MQIQSKEQSHNPYISALLGAIVTTSAGLLGGSAGCGNQCSEDTLAASITFGAVSAVSVMLAALAYTYCSITCDWTHAKEKNPKITNGLKGSITASALATLSTLIAYTANKDHFNNVTLALSAGAGATTAILFFIGMSFHKAKTKIKTSINSDNGTPLLVSEDDNGKPLLVSEDDTGSISGEDRLSSLENSPILGDSPI